LVGNKKLKLGPKLEKWLSDKERLDDYRRLATLSVDQIHSELTQRLVADLVENLPERPNCTCRAIVLLDTFDAFSIGSQNDAMLRDETSWIRDLYFPDSGILLVLAGQEELAWAEIDNDFSHSRYLRQVPLEGLTEEQARSYLHQAHPYHRGAHDRALAEALQWDDDLRTEKRYPGVEDGRVRMR
jgi:hypothetical protein